MNNKIKTHTSAGWIKVIAINLLILLCLLGGLEIGSYFLLKAIPFVSSMRIAHQQGQALSVEKDGRVNSPIYTDKNAARRMFRESNITTHYEPYTIWTADAIDGEQVHINRQGIRKTCQETVENLAHPKVQVFMFGGSTLFGTGTNDCATIPSLLAQKFKQNIPQLSVQVTNYGTTAYESTQELIQLIRLLQNGARPDVVVFLMA